MRRDTVGCALACCCLAYICGEKKRVPSEARVLGLPSRYESLRHPTTFGDGGDEEVLRLPVDESAALARAPTTSGSIEPGTVWGLSIPVP